MPEKTYVYEPKYGHTGPTRSAHYHCYPIPPASAVTSPSKEYYLYDDHNAGRVREAVNYPSPTSCHCDHHTCHFSPSASHHLVYRDRPPNVPAHMLPYFHLFESDQAHLAPVVYAQHHRPAYTCHHEPAVMYTHLPVGHAHHNCPCGKDHAASGPTAWQGSTRAEVDAQNAAIWAATAKPVQLAPCAAAKDQQFWCRELDGSYTLRTLDEISDNLQPGEWREAQSGYPYFVRQKV